MQNGYFTTEISLNQMVRNLIIGAFILLSTFKVSGQDTLLWLKNNQGIVEDVNGSVTLWENQIEENGDATQSVSALGGEQLQEAYPGKVNVGFVNDGSHLTLDGSNAYFSDNSFSVFYVGKIGDVGTDATLLGNMKPDGDWDNSAGIRFVRRSNGNMTFQYGAPNQFIRWLNIIPEDEYFFFGFSMESNGDYKYFDNTTPILKTGNISQTIVYGTDDLDLNLHHLLTGPVTYDQTEVAELLIFDDAFNETGFVEVREWIAQNYPELIQTDFTVREVLPASRVDITNTQDITVTFTQNIDASSVYPEIVVDKGAVQVSGSWTLSAPNQLTFSNNNPWPYGALVSLELDDNLKSTEDVALDVGTRSSYKFIVESEEYLGLENVLISPMATVDFPIVGHVLPLKLVLPTVRDEKIPVHIWVHGGGWSGGTQAESAAVSSPHEDYLAENLGIATLGIAYRCNGSNGNFTLAMEDIDAAYQWMLDNAEIYNFDTDKVFFSGGSAGTPLAALASQRYPSVIGFIGFNGMYDFVNDNNSFGQGNGYGQETPSAAANSAIFQLRENPPATIMMHGDADTTIPLSQSTLFEDAINAAGGQAETVIYPGEPHAFFNIGQKEYEDVLYEMAGFMSRILSGEDEEPRVMNTYVATTGDDNNLGTEASPFATLEKAYAESVQGDTIFVSAGVYTYTGGAAFINLTKSITIIGEGADVTIFQNGTDPVAVSKTNQGRFALMTTAGKNLTVEDLTIRNCGYYGSNLGGGTINLVQSTSRCKFTARRCNIVGGVARFGGAIQVTGSASNQVILEDCALYNNYAMPQIASGAYPQTGNYSGGVIQASSNSSIEISNCVFYRNGTLDNDLSIAIGGNSTLGRVIAMNNGQTDATSTITNCIFIDNTSIGLAPSVLAPAISHLQPSKQLIFINNIMVDNVELGSTGAVDFYASATANDYPEFFNNFKSNVIGKSLIDNGFSLDLSNVIDPSFSKGSSEILIDGGATPNYVINQFGVSTISASGSEILEQGIYGSGIRTEDINGKPRGANGDLGAVQSSTPVATIEISDLVQAYTGNSISVGVSTYPEGLGFDVLYNASSVEPTLPGEYVVDVTIDDPVIEGTASATLTIEKGDQLITFSKPAQQNLAASNTLTLSATGGDSGNPITYTSSDINVATIDNDIVTFILEGTVTITASQAGNDVYNVAADVNQEIEVIELYVWENSTWNSGAVPESGKKISFLDHFTLTDEMATESVIVGSGVTLIIEQNGVLIDNLEVQNNGTVIVKSGGSLITMGSALGTDYQIERTTTFDANTGQYSIVGSPVQNASFDVLGTEAIIYGYDELIPYDLSGNAGRDRFKTPAELSLTNMQMGNGYFSASTGDSEGKVVFTGIPNTGDLSVSLSYTDQVAASEDNFEGFNLVSNPYPSAISYSGLMAGNSVPAISKSIYLWDDMNSDVERGSNDDYLIVNSMGNTDSRSEGVLKWDGSIRSGQGFFVQTSAPETLYFNNAMRVSTDNSDDGFFRTANDISSFKLTFSNAAASKAIVIGFANDATKGMDKAYDAVSLSCGKMKFYSLNEQGDTKLGIQGLPHDAANDIALGYKASEAGDFEIGLGESTSFETELILYDRTTRQLVDLSLESYSFTSAIGEFDNRFVLNPTNVLGLGESPIANIYVSGRTLYFNYSDQIENEVQLFNLSGKKVLELKELNGSGTYDIERLPAGVYILKSENSSSKVVVGHE